MLSRLLAGVSVAGGDAINLVVSDASHGHSADNLSTNTDWLLSVSECSHSNTSDNQSLSTDWLLSVAESLHGHYAKNTALTAEWLLSIAESLHAHTIDNVDIDATGSALLEIQECLHAHIAENQSLSSEVFLFIAEALHAHLADIVVLGIITLFTQEELDYLLSYMEANLTIPTAEENAAAILAAAQVTPIHAEVKKIAGEYVDGAGTEADPWRPA